MVLREQDGRILVHLINLTTNQVVEDVNCNSDMYDVIPICEIEINLRRKDVSKIYRASDGQEIPYKLEGDGVTFKVPRLDIYEIIVCEVAKNQ